jgi:hypothetical protein
MIRVVRDSEVYQQHKSVVVISNYLGRDNAHYVKRFDDNGDYIWSIDNLRGRYSVVNSSTKVNFRTFDKAVFLDAVKENYPEDFEFFIWNQDIFKGELQ